MPPATSTLTPCATSAWVWFHLRADSRTAAPTWASSFALKSPVMAMSRIRSSWPAASRTDCTTGAPIATAVPAVSITEPRRSARCCFNASPRARLAASAVCLAVTRSMVAPRRSYWLRRAPTLRMGWARASAMALPIRSWRALSKSAACPSWPIVPLAVANAAWNDPARAAPILTPKSSSFAMYAPGRFLLYASGHV